MDLRDLSPPPGEGFFPPPTHHPPLTGERIEGARSITGISYAMIPGYRTLTLDLHVPLGVERPPVVVWIHGGGWTEGDRRYVPLQWPQQLLFEKVLAAGMAIATVDYRHLREAPFPACVHDVHAALRYLAAYSQDLGVDASRIGVWGESAGGHLACLAALAPARAAHGHVVDGVDLAGTDGVRTDQPLPRCLVSWYAPDQQLRDFIGRWDGATPAADESIVTALLTSSQASRWAPPTLIMHGDQDSVVGVENAVTLHRALEEALEGAATSVTLQMVEKAEHCFLGVPVEPLMDDAVNFLGLHLLQS